MNEREILLANYRKSFAAVIAGLEAENAALRLESEELRGVVETYGRIVSQKRQDMNALELNYMVSSEVFRAGGMEIFNHSIQHCQRQWLAMLQQIRDRR